MAPARFVSRFAAIALVATGLAAPAPPTPPPVTLRIAFSAAMFTDVNENDAQAAIKAWTQTVAQERGIAGKSDAMIIDGVGAMIKALQTGGRVDGAVLPIDEFAAVSRVIPFSHFFIATHRGELTEEYVVLVHRDSAFQQLAQLRGGGLLVYRNVRTCLAEPWLDTRLLQSRLPAATTFFGQIQHVPKLSKAILPVFFRQADACLVTRAGFDTMCELNPQLRLKLHVLATSPAVVPAVTCVCARYHPAILEQIMASMRELHLTPAGQQVLTVFHGERLEEHPAELLAPTLALLAEHARLIADPACSAPAAAPSASAPAAN